MRIFKLLAIVAIALLGVAATGMAASRSRPGPVVLHLKWRLVSPIVNGTVIANNRFLFFPTQLVAAEGTRQGVLVDTRTGKRTSIAACTPSNTIVAPGGAIGSGVEGSPDLGGPWFMLKCGEAANLYNPSTGRWTEISAPTSLEQQPTCPTPPYFPGTSPPVHVGTYWIRWGCELQNISTGMVKSDPVTRGGTIYDDLNAPSGVARLCSPLRYPGARGVLNFYDGRFALIGKQSGGPGDHLLRCGSRLNLTMPNAAPAIPIDSQAMVGATRTKHGPVIQGLFFPSLRRFVIHPPHRFGSTPAPVALSQRTLYVQTAGLGGELWAAQLPKSP